MATTLPLPPHFRKSLFINSYCPLPGRVEVHPAGARSASMSVLQAQPVAERFKVRALPSTGAGASTNTQAMLPTPVAATPAALKVQLAVLACPPSTASSNGLTLPRGHFNKKIARHARFTGLDLGHIADHACHDPALVEQFAKGLRGQVFQQASQYLQQFGTVHHAGLVGQESGVCGQLGPSDHLAQLGKVILCVSRKNHLTILCV